MAEDEDEFELPKLLQDLLDKVEPVDALILAGGGFIGWVGGRPGFTLPGVYIGLPDFTDLIAHWTREKEKSETRLQGLIDARQAYIDQFADEDCSLTRTEFFATLPADMPSGEKGRMWLAHQRRCQEGIEDAAAQDFDPKIADERRLLGTIKRELYKFKVAQSLGMGILAYAVTRPGFLQGVGQIVTGVGEIIPG